jgi:hypothetical protein
MNSSAHALLRRFAAKYVWWKTPDEALHQPGVSSRKS